MQHQQRRQDTGRMVASLVHSSRRDGVETLTDTGPFCSRRESTMIWGRRKFAFADYALYQDRLQKLLLANPTRYRQFIMVAVDIEGRTERMYYVGVPDRAFLA